MTDEEKIARANRAHAIVNDDVYAQAMKDMQAEIISQWAASGARDTEGREWLWRHYQVSLKFEEKLQETMNTGKLAADALRMKKAETLLDKVNPSRYWSRNAA